LEAHGSETKAAVLTISWRAGVHLVQQGCVDIATTYSDELPYVSGLGPCVARLTVRRVTFNPRGRGSGCVLLHKSDMEVPGSISSRSKASAGPCVSAGAWPRFYAPSRVGLVPAWCSYGAVRCLTVLYGVRCCIGSCVVKCSSRLFRLHMRRAVRCVPSVYYWHLVTSTAAAPSPRPSPTSSGRQKLQPGLQHKQM
jgi:hypothetical protein